MAEKVRLLHVFAFQKMLRKNRHGHIVQKCHVGGIQFKRDRMIVDHINLLYILIVRRILRTILRIHDGFDGKFHVIGCESFTVMPFDSLFQMERVGTGLLIKLPAFCQCRNHLILSVMGSQSVKDQNVDLPMLIHCRIDPCIVSASIYKSRCVCMHRRCAQKTGKSHP